MSLLWSDWEAVAGDQSPYVDWWHYAGLDPYGSQGGEGSVLAGGFLTHTGGEATVTAGPSIGDDAAQPLTPEMRAELARLYGDQAPVPAQSANPEFWDHVAQSPNGWCPDEVDLPLVEDPNAIIVGIVDSGIGLGNSMFRTPDGGSRVLASWQQSAVHPRDPDGASRQPYLPFGRELYRQDIEQYLEAHSTGGRQGRLDEAAFNAAAGLVEMRRLQGSRELMGTMSHGNLVAGAAAGLHPVAANDDVIGKMQMITVNLPNRQTIGLSGTFLDFYIIYAIERIADLADRIWQKSQSQDLDSPTAPPDEKGFRIVINLSFGKQAGPKDGYGLFERYLSDLNARRETAGQHRVEVILPVGNDNLLQSRAVLTCHSASKESQIWRVQPTDQSSNYVEIWSPKLEKVKDGPASVQPVPLAISVTPPAQPEQQPIAGQHRMARTISNRARLYCDLIDGEDGFYRIRYVVCLAPTQRPGRLHETAPAGDWTITLENLEGASQDVTLSVQTDQSVLPRGRTGLRSYFVDPHYKSHDRDTGRWIDSYSYGPEGDPELTDNTAGTVHRRGTINATSTVTAAAAIAGYRHSDGKPTSYSATGSANTGPAARPEPTMAMPSDDSPILWGTLGPGAQNGSVIRGTGTSFSSAQATRVVAEAWLAGHQGSAEDILQAHESSYAPHGSEPAKVGAGQKSPPALYRVKRGYRR